MGWPLRIARRRSLWFWVSHSCGPKAAPEQRWFHPLIIPLTELSFVGVNTQSHSQGMLGEATYCGNHRTA